MKAKELTNEELATILRMMCITGICPTRYERDYLQEAADRLERGTDEKELCEN